MTRKQKPVEIACNIIKQIQTSCQFVAQNSAEETMGVACPAQTLCTKWVSVCLNLCAFTAVENQRGKKIT